MNTSCADVLSIAEPQTATDNSALPFLKTCPKRAGEAISSCRWFGGLHGSVPEGLIFIRRPRFFRSHHELQSRFCYHSIAACLSTASAHRGPATRQLHAIAPFAKLNWLDRSVPHLMPIKMIAQALLHPIRLSRNLHQLEPELVAREQQKRSRA